MAFLASGRVSIWFSLAALALGQHCYYGPGPNFQAPDNLNLLPCLETGYSSCCFAGDVCLAGGACYDFTTTNTYQYGCTDPSYKDPSCPFKCGWSPNHSPWVALENCANDGMEDIWVCQSPESCGCEWRSSYQLLELPPRGCDAMGSLARVAVSGGATLEPYASLPGTQGGSTGYYSGSASTVITGFTPNSVGPTLSFSMPTTVLQLNKNGVPAPSVGTATLHDGSEPPIPITGVLAQSTSYPPEILAGITSGITIASGNSGPKETNQAGGSGSSTGGGGSGSNGGNSSGGGLPTDAKIGIGVGVAGGVCLLAAILLVAFVLRRRKKQPQAPTQDPDYMEGYNEKPQHQSYQSYTSAPSAAYYDPYQRGSPSPGLYEAPGTTQDDEVAKKRLSPQGPQEIGGSQLHEMESNTGTPTSTPALSPVIGSHSRSASGLQ